MSKRIRLSNIIQDDKNFNRHSDSGLELLKKSVEKVGVIESITVSADYIETDGKRPVILKRTDIKSGTRKFQEAALLANTTAKQNINLDIELIQEIAVDEFDIDIVELGVEINDMFDEKKE